ncbi:alpha/beta hydrolase family protein [Variovorax paradoxus]|nr:S9 family peptidase [Variovorax paradoxus]
MFVAFRRLSRGLAAILAMGLGPGFAAETPDAPHALSQPAPIPLRAFAELPAVQMLRMSPDGRGAAMVQNMDGQSYVVVSGFGNKPKVLLHTDNDKYVFSSLRWAGNQRLLVGTYFLDHRRGVATGETRLIAVDRDGGNMKADLFGTLQGNSIFEQRRHTPQYQDRIVGGSRDEPETVLIAFDSQSPGHPDVYRLDVRTGRSRLLQRNLGGIRNWMADTQGVVRLGSGATRTTLRVMVKPPEIQGRSSEWVALATYDGTDAAEARRQALTPLGFDADPRFLYALAPVDGRDALVRIDLHDPAFTRQTLLADARFDVRGNLLRDPVTQRVVGIEYHTDAPRVLYWDDTARQRQEALDRAFPQRSNFIVNDDEAGRSSVVLSVQGSRPPRYFTMDWTSGKLGLISDTHPALEKQALATPKRVALRSRDGLPLEGYLTLPPAREAEALAAAAPRPLPTILLPHGGPAAANTGSYDYWAQFFASRGWAVLQINFRGSIGYGQDFRDAGRRRWGLEMQDDLADGLRWMIGQGIADPQRACIAGGSYGGYAALMGAVKDPTLYRCAISVAGPSDLRDLLSHSQNYMGYQLGAEAEIGTWWGDREKLRQTSPALRASEIRVPVLLIHGANDLLVPVEQSRDMAEALRKANHADARYVELPLGDHWMSREDDRVRVLTEMEQFLRKNLE